MGRGRSAARKIAAKRKTGFIGCRPHCFFIPLRYSDETAVELSKRILIKAENNLSELSRMNVKELMTFKGIGEAKAITIVAALELGKRSKDSGGTKKDRITCSRDLVEIFQPLLGDHLHEEFWILFLNRANMIIGKQAVSTGG